MISLNQVTKQYGPTTVLKNITLSIEEPGIYCLLGRNGAGKTTFLKSIAGYQNITTGTIQVDGKTISTAALDTGVSYIENFAKHFNLPVRKLLQIASEVNPNYDYDFASEMMERFELDGKKKFNHLSLGIKTMVSTIICLASNKTSFFWMSLFSALTPLCVWSFTKCWQRALRNTRALLSYPLTLLRKSQTPFKSC